MKCLVLLVLVAVCHGVVIRDPLQGEQIDERRHVTKEYIQKLKSHDYPQLQVELGQLKQRLPRLKHVQEQREKRDQKSYPGTKSILGQMFVPRSSFHASMELNKDSSKVPLRMNLNSPLGWYTRPQTFDYTKTLDSGEPWNQITPLYPDVLDFKSFRDLIQFPGSDFLLNEIDKCLWNMPEDARMPVDMPTNQYTPKFPFGTNMQINWSKVKDVRDVLPYIVTKLEKFVPLYMEMTNDPSAVAILVTRDLIKIVLHGRMECPRTTWDKRFIENINAHLYKVANEKKYQLVEGLRTFLPKVLPDSLDLVDQLVYTIDEDVQERVYKDVMQYAHGVAFKDVAIVCQKLYKELKLVFENSFEQNVPTLMQQLVAVVAKVITNYGTCQGQQYFYRNEEACWDFNKLFLERELADVHSRVMNIIHQFVYPTCNEECMHYYPRVSDVLKTIVKRYIATVVQRVPMCQTPECLDPAQCLLNGYPLLEPARVEQVQTRIPLWNTLFKRIDQDRQL